jgi:hypothetical protein
LIRQVLEPIIERQEKFESTEAVKLMQSSCLSAKPLLLSASLFNYFHSLRKKPTDLIRMLEDSSNYHQAQEVMSRLERIDFLNPDKVINLLKPLPKDDVKDSVKATFADGSASYSEKFAKLCVLLAKKVEPDIHFFVNLHVRIFPVVN